MSSFLLFESEEENLAMLAIKNSRFEEAEQIADMLERWVQLENKYEIGYLEKLRNAAFFDFYTKIRINVAQKKGDEEKVRILEDQKAKEYSKIKALTNAFNTNEIVLGLIPVPSINNLLSTEIFERGVIKYSEKIMRLIVP